MYLISVDFSKNNLLTEQLNVRSFYDLQVLNSSLTEHQLNKFSDIKIKKAFLTDKKINKEFSLCEAVVLNIDDIYRELFSFSPNERVLLLRNDTYFECDISEILHSVYDNEITGIKNNKNFCFAIFCQLDYLKKLYNKNISFHNIMNNYEKYVTSYLKAEGYIKKLESVNDYKSLLFDILNGKTIFKPPYIAEGIFTDGVVPKGDFSITPPVYLGDSVQIENGSSIGPNTVIFNNSLISRNSSVKNSILFENVYVSSNCFIDGTVCCENSSVKRNSAVFAGSVIGANALIGEDVTVENNSMINKNVKYDKFIKSPFNNKIYGSFQNKFQGLSPDKAALLGSAVANVFGKPRILIASDGEPNSQAIKLAFLSGLIASGAECFDIGNTFKSQIFFSCKFCECDYSAFVSGRGGGTNIEIYNSKNELLSKTDCYNLLDFCSKNKFIFVEPSECKNVRQIHGLRRMYVREITVLCEEGIKFVPSVFCKNKIVLKTFEEILKKIAPKDNSNSEMHIIFNDTGTNVSIEYKNRIYVEKDLKKLLFFYLKNDELKGHFYSYSYINLWKVDSLFLAFLIIKILNLTEEKIDKLISSLPGFYTSSKTAEIPLKTGEIARKIDDLKSVNYKNGCYNIKLKNGFAKVQKKPFLNEAKIISASESVSASAEICDFIQAFLEDV